MVGRSITRGAAWVMVTGVALAFLGVALFTIVGLGSLPSSGDPWSDLAGEVALAGAGSLVVAGALVALLGLTLYVLGPAFGPREQAQLDHGSHRVVLACTVLAAVVGNLLATLYFFVVVPLFNLQVRRGAVVEGGVSGQLLSPEGIAVAAVSLDVALLAVVYLRIVRPGAISWAAMGLNSHRLAGRLLLGLGYGVLLFGVSSLLEYMLSQVGVHQTQGATFQSVTSASPQQFGLVLAAGAVMAPIVEEIYFRGFVFRAYLNQKGVSQAFVFSSGLFAVVHVDLAALVPIFSVGFLLSFLYYRTGSIVPGMVAHATNNVAAFTLLYLGIS